MNGKLNGRNSSHEFLSGEAAIPVEWARVNSELLRLAHRRLTREPRAVSYDTQELVQETWERLILQRTPFQGNEHVCGTARIVMDRLLIDRARRKQRLKRQAKLTPLGDEIAVETPSEQRDLDDAAAMAMALERLRAFDQRQARMVELRFVAGMSASATAVALGVTRRTVDRDWAHARCWLRREIDRIATDPGVPDEAEVFGTRA